MHGPQWILIWLKTGLVLVFLQVVIGGITRLTESGLSITKWEIVSGTIPPVNEQQWEKEFELYKATPQYKEINEGMSMSDFKIIYFWEYIHRFWARFMGFVFIIPFLIFWRKNWISKPLLQNLGIVVFLAALAATFGWIMVASGLVERPWVNAYKLSIHLMIAFAVFGSLYWTYLSEKYTYPDSTNTKLPFMNIFYLFFGLFIFQLLLGGMMSGMKIAVVYPTWPTMNGEWIPSAIKDASAWNITNLNEYDSNEFAPALVHFFHRMTAYILLIILLLFVWKVYKEKGKLQEFPVIKQAIHWIVIVFFVQIFLGIITVVSSKGSIPVWIGVAHQAGALLLLTTLINFIFKAKKLLH